MAFPWPVALRPRDVTWTQAATSASGGRSLAGTELVVASDAGYWRAEITLDISGPLRAGRVLALRALGAQLQGRVGQVMVPCMDVYRPRNGQGRVVGGHLSAFLGTGTLWDLTGFGQTEPVYAQAASLAPLRATQMSLTINEGEGLQPGQYFGIGARLYLVGQSWRVTPASPQIVRFWPPLREACASGTQILLGAPVCTMRLQEDDGLAVALSNLRRGQVTLKFEEVT